MNLTLDQAHVDLRYVLRSLGSAAAQRLRAAAGHRGATGGRDGYFAVLLWTTTAEAQPEGARDAARLQHPGRGQPEALLVTAYNLKIRPTPFVDATAAGTVAPELPSGQTGDIAASGATTHGSGRAGDARSP